MNKISIALISILLGLGLSPQAARAACSSSQVSGFSSDAIVTENRVLLCASEANQGSKTSTSSSRSKTSSPKRSMTLEPNCTVKAITTEQIIAAALAGCSISGPSYPPSQSVSKPRKAVSTATTLVSATRQNGQATLEAQPLLISASKSLFNIGESVVLTSDAVEHERSAVILGRVASVRFTPVGYRWSVEDDLGSPIAVTAFAFPGNQTISLQLSYRASSRFSSSEQWQYVGLVTARAELQVVVVESSANQQSKAIPRLVYGSCDRWPSKYRC